MMQSPSKLSRSIAPVFLDTSVLINLLAADCVEEMAIALARPLQIAEQVSKELIRDPRDGGDGSATLKRLVLGGALGVVALDAAQGEQFVALVGAAPPDDLGDGEAATLACGCSGCVAIDERKARRIALRDFPNLTLYSTLDLLTSDQAISHFGAVRVRKMIGKARAVGRMRILPEWRDWIASDGSSPATRS